MYIERSKWTSLAGIIAIFVIIPIAALSEPYTVSKGDTLSKVAKDHGVTLAALRAANDDQLANSDQIKVGQVLIIPEDPSALDSASQPTAAPNTSTDTKGQSVTNAKKESQDVVTLRKGIEENHWVVTRNPKTGKVFVHERMAGNTLVGMRYVIDESEGTWTLYRAENRSQRVGVMEKPEISIGLCGCQ